MKSILKFAGSKSGQDMFAKAQEAFTGKAPEGAANKVVLDPRLILKQAVELQWGLFGSALANADMPGMLNVIADDIRWAEPGVALAVGKGSELVLCLQNLVNRKLVLEVTVDEVLQLTAIPKGKEGKEDKENKKDKKSKDTDQMKMVMSMAEKVLKKDKGDKEKVGPGYGTVMERDHFRLRNKETGEVVEEGDRMVLWKAEGDGLWKMSWVSACTRPAAVRPA